MRVSWTEFIEYVQEFRCPDCEHKVEIPERCNDGCMECFAEYIEHTVKVELGQ